MMFAAFLEEVRYENEILRKCGAVEQAKAREALLEDLEKYLEGWISASEAAELAQVHPETVRRAVRSQEIVGRMQGRDLYVQKAAVTALRSKSRLDTKPASVHLPTSRILEAAKNARR